MPTPAAAFAEPASDCRCPCGSLLARLVPQGVELKCRRCKRTVLIGWSALENPRPEAPSPESRRRASARPRRTRWLEACDEHS